MLRASLLPLSASDLGTSEAGVAPRQLIEAMCREQAETLVGAAAHGFARAQLRPLLEWTVARACGPVVRGVLKDLQFDAT